MDDRPRPPLNWRAVLGWVLVAASLGFVVRWLSQVPGETWKSFAHIKLAWLLGSLAVFEVWFGLRFALWHRLTAWQGTDAARSISLRRWAISEFLRYIPGSVVMFAARYKGAVDSGASRVGASSAVVAEALGLVSGAAAVGSLWLTGSWRWIGLGCVAVFGVIFPIVHRWLLARRGDHGATAISHGRAIGLILGYVVVWLTFGLANVLLYQGVPGLAAISSTALLGISVAAWMIGYLSIVTPMGLGVREVAFVQLLRPWLTTPVASAFATVSRLWLIVAELIFVGCVVVLTRSKSSRS